MLICSKKPTEAEAVCGRTMKKFINYFLQDNAASAIEYIFVFVLSPLEERTQGTFAPTTIAANSALANLVQDL